MNAVTGNPKTELAAAQVSARVGAALDLLRGKTLDGRDTRGMSAAALLEMLFATQECPGPDAFAFWTDPDGKVWLYVERELREGKRNYIVAVGNMGTEQASLALTALGLVNEAGKVRAYADGAFFSDEGDPGGEHLILQRRVGEAEFVSHVRPSKWSGAFRFTAGKDAVPSEYVASADDEHDRDEQSDDQDGGDGTVTATADDDDDGGYDAAEPYE